MSKYAGSPGRSIRSVKTCGCGLQRSPEIALTPSMCSEPSSNSRLLTSATQSFSRKPGRSSRNRSSYAASTIAHAVFSSVTSSSVLTIRMSCISACPSTTVIPAASSARSTGSSTMSTPSGSPSKPSWSSSTRIFSATASARPTTEPRSVEIPARERSSPSHGL